MSIERGDPAKDPAGRHRLHESILADGIPAADRLQRGGTDSQRADQVIAHRDFRHPARRQFDVRQPRRTGHFTDDIVTGRPIGPINLFKIERLARKVGDAGQRSKDCWRVCHIG